MACGCSKGRSTQKVASGSKSANRVVYEAFGGNLAEPEHFDTITAARDYAKEQGARVRSLVVRAPQPAAVGD